MRAFIRILTRWSVYGGASRAPIWIGYVFAVVSLAVAVLASVQFASVLRGSPFPLLLFAVVLSAWLGGPGPGILAALLGTVSVEYLLTFPLFVQRLGAMDYPLRLLIYVGVAVIVVLLSNAERIALGATEAERRRLQQILDVLPQSVILLDRMGRCAHANVAAQHLLGGDPTDQGAGAAARPGAAPLSLRDADGVTILDTDLPTMRAARRGVASDNVLLRVRNAKTGDDIPVLASSAPLYDQKGTLNGAVTILQDIRALREFDQQKEAFLAAVAHDLRNPLTNIRGDAHLLLRKIGEGGSDPAMSRGLTSIERATIRLSEMIDELVDIGRLQMNRPLELERRWTDLVALATTVAEEYRQADIERQFDVVGVPALHGEWDEVRLRRVLDNLLNNAVKYSPADTPITIRVEKERDGVANWAVLAVQDRGLGIPAADVPHIFERYHRAGNVRGRVAGTGLGLAGARQLARQHGGALTVESQEGQGSVFTLRLPLPEVMDEG